MKITIEQITQVLQPHGMALLKSFAFGRYHRIDVRVEEGGLYPCSLTIMGIKFERLYFFGEYDSVYECVFSNEVLWDSVKVEFECTE